MIEKSALFIAGCSFVFTLYYSIIYPRKKACEGKLVWDELLNEYYIIIRNTGRAPLIIDSIELYFCGQGKRVSIGKRESLFNNGEMAKVLLAGDAMKHVPVKGSLYDVFAYRGHYFDVDDSNKNEKIFMELKGLYGESYIYRTDFTLGEIEDKL